jgi:cobalt/nickel transport system permease protein
MHMADALISPAVGGTFWVASAGLIGYCCKKVKSELNDFKVPLMGVAGAFVFAAQMINYTIPGTGSSGHLGGGMILAILLGPWAGFLVMASVLIVQALFFADGGILALGCNIFNLGFWTCFVVYPLVYKRIVGKDRSQSKLFWGSMLSVIIGLQLGALCVVLQTVLSGRAELPFSTFLLAMQPIHLGIGIIEGFITVGVVSFVAKSQPQLLEIQPIQEKTVTSTRFVVVSLLVAAAITGGAISWFASGHPDGLEWSMFKTAGVEELDKPENPVYDKLSGLQETTAILPDYGFKETEDAGGEEESSESWPAVDVGTTVSGLVGGLLTLILAFGMGFLLKLKSKQKMSEPA